ncbi:hypothetical protein [Listeria monocytogenes]|uniref:hypothetical protein n=1 Tax=Listeria monocytogenes TaxID=1639 RepID=UPI000737C301|nr:hypothetical protein [Listeria monocytogenes]EAD2079579.1 hypothetical protein [Listeria monocytogenes]EAH1841809.1 hypothetical protein [Listeria monocytogenes]ECW2836838.1 hypothetical protein [Listeria monocytogenes]EGT2128137.1 hypothetical protein [Listeria monocytogenes]EIC0890904.1 hypothetical protein [Listeria monocytogenes]
MSSELVKKLEDREQTLRENLFYESAEDYDQGYLHGFFEAMAIVEQHEAQQMKEPFYQLDERQQEILSKCKEVYINCDKRVAAMYVYSFLYDSAMDNLSVAKILHAFTTWAIEQEKLEEEK